MKPITHVLIWLIELFTLSILYSILCYLVPGEEIYGWYEEHYGFVMENQWYGWYTLILMIIAVLINCGLIWFTVKMYAKKTRRDKTAC